NWTGTLRGPRLRQIQARGQEKPPSGRPDGGLGREERSTACNPPAMKPAVSAATASAAAENLVGHALLIGRERRVKRFFHRQKLVEPLRSHDHALTLPLVSLDGCRPFAVRSALPHLGAALLKALFHRGGVLALHVGVRVPLRLLGGRDLERRAHISEAS